MSQYDARRPFYLQHHAVVHFYAQFVTNSVACCTVTNYWPLFAERCT